MHSARTNSNGTGYSRDYHHQPNKRCHEDIYQRFTKKCGACFEWTPFSAFSMDQASKGPSGRCKDCVGSNNPIGSGRAPTGASLPPKAGNPTSARITPPKKFKVELICCKHCSTSQKGLKYPKDWDPKNAKCVACIVKATPRECKDCKVTKPKDQFSSYNWELPSGWKNKLNNKKTTEQILDMVAKECSIKCRDCETIRRERAEKKEEEEDSSPIGHWQGDDPYQTIRTAIDELLPTVDSETTGVKKFIKLLSKKKFGGADLKQFREFIQETLTEAINNQESQEEEEEEEKKNDGDEKKKTVAKAFSIKCLDCETTRREREQKAAQEKAARQKALLEKHNVQFYDTDVAFFGGRSHPLRVQCSKLETDKVAGEYDIVLHAGFCAGEDIENRTTKGTVVLEGKSREEEDSTDACGMVLTGKVEFHPELRSETICFQNDFDLTEGSLGDGLEYSLKAELIDERAKDVVHMNGKPAEATLKRVEKRTACPWMKHEDPEMNEEEGDKIQFETLEEAEALAKEHEDGPESSTKPKPVFFLEPGDLILRVDWSDDHREQVFTYCILRKKH